MTERCPNYDREYGCQDPLGKGLWPQARINEIRSGDGFDDVIARDIICQLIKRKLIQGLNYKKLPELR